MLFYQFIASIQLKLNDAVLYSLLSSKSIVDIHVPGLLSSSTSTSQTALATPSPPP
jgi:hypothetical protein